MKNVTVVRHKFVKGERVKTVPFGELVTIVKVSFAVGYEAVNLDGTIKHLDESELRFICGPPARRK